MNTNICPTCKTSIPANAPGGFCPGCILRDADELPPIGRTAPSLDEVRAAFPQLEVLELIGQGGMGFVYKARQPSLDRTVALKILSPELGRDPAFAERFAREARVLGKLNHPNIVTVFEHGESGGFFYLIMEHVDGVNLRQAMRAGRFTPAQALAVVPGICDALQAAHAQGVWHRDIKPENILLDAQGGVKIVDFGIARIVGDPQRDFTLTMTGAALGSAAYMAPEQHESPHDVDHRADIYSLGVVIYEMLTGELPLGRFKAPSTKAAVDARIDEIVFRTLEKERELRQQSANEVKTDVFNAASAPAVASSDLRQPSKLTLWSIKLMLCGGILIILGAAIYDGVAYSPTHSGERIFGAFLLGLGALAATLGYVGACYSLWLMHTRLAPTVWRPVLRVVTVLPALYYYVWPRVREWWKGRARTESAPIIQSAAESPFGLPKPLLWSAALLLAGLAMGGTGWFIFANLHEARAAGAVVAGLGAPALIFGLIGSIWSLVEMKRGTAPATGRKLLIALVVVPASIGCAFAAFGSAAATGVPQIRGSILVLAALIIAGLGIALSLIFKLARPLGEPTPRRTKLARASLVASAFALVGCAVLAKRCDQNWPHVFNKESATLILNRDAKPSDEELLALLKKAAGPRVSDYELSAKNGRAKVTAVVKQFQPFIQLNQEPIASSMFGETRSHSQACLARLRDLLPSAAIHQSRLSSEIPLGVYTEEFALGRGGIGLLATLGAVFAALAGGRRARNLIVAGIALHLALIALPVWHLEDNRRVMEGALLPMFTAADIASAPDFSTPDKAVTSVYDAACWGNREVARRGMSKALAAGLDAQDGWDEFFERNAGRRMVATLSPKAKPDRFYNQLQVQTSYINRTGTSTSGDHTWVVQEDGEWRLDQLTYIGKNGEVTAPATWFAKKKVADAAKAAKDAAKPEPEVAVAPAMPAESAESVLRKLNVLANESNGDEFKKHVTASSGGIVAVPMAKRMEPFLGTIQMVKVVGLVPEKSNMFIGKIPARTTVFAEFTMSDGKTLYREFVFELVNGNWRYGGDHNAPHYRAKTRIEFRPETGDPLAILKTHLGNETKVEPAAGEDRQFDLIREDIYANGAVAAAINSTSDLAGSLKKVGLTFKIINAAEEPKKPIHAENVPTETRPMHIHFLPGNRIAVDGKAAAPDELIALLKQPNDGKPKWRFEVETEAGVEGRFIASVLKKMKAVGAKFDEDVMAKLRDSMKAEEATPAAPVESAKLEAPVEKAKTPPAKTVISLRANGDLELDGKPVAFDALGEQLKKIVPDPAAAAVLVTSDKDSKYEDATRLLKELTRLGVSNVAFAQPAAAKTFFISGQVAKPGIIAVPEQPVTVSMAVSLAGGPTRNAWLSKVQLHRVGADGTRKTIIVDVKKALEGKATKAEDPVLEAGDKINVPENFF